MLIIHILKLTFFRIQHCKPAILEKNKNHKIKKKQFAELLHCLYIYSFLYLSISGTSSDIFSCELQLLFIEL